LGIDTTEEEMASLCLTQEGTTWLGLYHGLSTRLRGSGYKPEFFECTVEQLPDVIAQFPALLCCELSDSIDEQFPEYQEIDGWIPGIAHSTVLFAAINGQHFIGDPSQPEPELWSVENMTHLWTGRGLRIVRVEQ
jgi:hypothetical protein